MIGGGLRRSTLVSALLLAALPNLASAPEAAGSRLVGPPSPEPLNIVMIVTDDQRALGTMQVMPETRRWFQTGGTTFERAYATTPTCCPSRASIMTGRFAHNHGVHTSAPGQAQLLDQETTLQRYLWDAGYLSGLFGKYLNEWPMEEPPPYFHHWATRNKNPTRSYKDGRWNVDGEVRKIERYATDFLGSRAVRFLRYAEVEDDRPFFLYFSPHAPHSPSLPARRHQGEKVGPFEDNPATTEVDLSDKPAYVAESTVERSVVTRQRRRALRTLMAADEAIGRLFSELEAAGELDNTLAIFLSDNGFMWGEHRVNGKRFPYLDSVRIPLFVRWPERFTPGSTDERLVGTVDLAPTIFEATGIIPEHDLDGRSLLSDHDRQRLLLEHWNREDRATPDWASFITKDTHYIEYYLAERLVVGEREFYDLLSDPWETLNLFGDGNPNNDPDVTMMSLQLNRALTCIGTAGPNPCP